MAVTMYASSDPDASVATLVSSTGIALVVAALACYLYRPLRRRPMREEPALRSSPRIPARSLSAR